MNLFRTENLQPENLLPCDGIADYHGCILAVDEATRYYQILLDTIDWRHDEAIMFGKKIITRRMVAWYGDQPFQYSYSNTHKVALAWTVELLELKKICEQHSGETYNSCLLNLYHDGSEGMAYHSDGEKDLKPNGAIASLTLGAERKFSFKHKESKETVSVLLEHGSLLVMKGETQQHWLHRLPPTKKVHAPRVNLTFRTIVNANG